MCILIKTKSETLSFILASEYVNESWERDLHRELRIVGPLREASESR